ncbi:hypothetical protein E4U42_004168 [Claviceps africana]|uniref:PLD phosphodiesterase domain-containing protein n=1 Tax=Claviceps africana TaxID=83212 RepID=A0A8K0J8E4_9HYPO|nr:hypothetical protein E4U42_004168 [Claviceps africana]
MVSQDESEDEDLKYAIALSLQQRPRTEQQEEGEEEGKGGEGGGGGGQGRQGEDGVSEPVHPGVGDASFTLLSLNRKRMEDERLARLAAKRTRSDSRDDDVEEIPAPKRGRKSPANHQNDHAPIPYPNGVVKRTWARGYETSEDVIHIDEILQKDKLLLAIFSSFQWNESWLLGKINLSQTKVLLAAFAANDAQKELMRQNAPDNVRFCFPPMHGYHCMHSKLQILKFPNYLRIVIPTGNLVPYDWGETGLMENMVFLIDLPLSSREDNKPPQMTLFQSHLQQYLHAMGVGAEMIASLSKYDFAKTADLGFVYSIPGRHLTSSPSPVGFAGLATTVAALGLASHQPIQVDYACASLGALKYDFLKSIYSACQGSINLGAATGTKSGKDDVDALQLQENFRIYFPSNDTVVSSRGGERAAGTICFQENWWKAPTFPKELMRDCVNTRDGLLMHSKLILVRQAGTSATGAEKKVAWAYIGSANLSESAWGSVVRGKAAGEGKILCRNWECGVVVPVRTASQQNSPSDMGIFSGTVPVPMQVPGRQYSPNEQPWFFRGSRIG